MYTLFFFNDTATTEIYTLSLHDALPIWSLPPGAAVVMIRLSPMPPMKSSMPSGSESDASEIRSEEHTSELQSRQYLVCRLLLDQKLLSAPFPRPPCTDHDHPTPTVHGTS